MRPLVYSDTITVRTDAELRAAIDGAAARVGATASDWVRRAVSTIISAPPPPSVRLAAVPAHAIDKAWPEVEGWLDRACQRPGCDTTASDLRGICEREEGMLVAMVDEDGRPVAAGVTQVRNHASGRRTCWILAVGGTRMRDWLATLESIEAGAAAISCSTVEFEGRPGWARLLHGYTAEPCEAGLHFSKSLGAQS